MTAPIRSVQLACHVFESVRLRRSADEREDVEGERVLNGEHCSRRVVRIGANTGSMCLFDVNQEGCPKSK